MSLNDTIDKMNKWGSNGVPFLFAFDFEGEQAWAIRSEEIDPRKIRYRVPGRQSDRRTNQPLEIEWQSHPMSLETYQEKFQKVYTHLSRGDSYLVNLTARTPLTMNCTLEELFDRCEAPYCLWVKDDFLVFSPECFVRIQEGVIRTFPMKGTIDASIPQAADRILSDQKELAEHVTIVDLLRNDLSQVADQVEVTRFRYIDKIQTHRGELLQVSSEIVGHLRPGYDQAIGTFMATLLPAGSVTGAPKDRTKAIIQEAEGYPRGFYTGIFGFFDGQTLDSAVMIRFIEQEGSQYYFRSGGGITARSNARMEYDELIRKIYVPVH